MVQTVRPRSTMGGTIGGTIGGTLGGAIDGGGTLDHNLELLGQELHTLLERVDPARWRPQTRATAQDAMARLRGRALAVRQQLRQPSTNTDADALIQVLETVELATAQPDLDAVDVVTLRSRLTAAYDALGIALRARTIATPRNRPTNYLRNLYHIGNAIAVLLLIEVLVERQGMIATAAAFAGFAWSAEILRRVSPAVNRLLMRGFGVVAHPDEHWTINSATWMTTALLIVSLSFALPACTVAVMVLGLGDPAAAIIGRRFGRTRLRGRRTLEGALAFVAFAASAAAAALASFHPELSVGAVSAMALGGALPAAIAELFAGDYVLAGRRFHLDDNFAIPLTAALGASAAAALLG